EPPQSPMLDLILVRNFHLPVLLGGIALLVFVALRAFAVWQETGRPVANHDHAHDHCHGNHGHGECHDHDHGHHHDHAITTDPPGHSRARGIPADPHEHVHDHAHDHGWDMDEAHSHVPGENHGHDHGWSPWRYAVLLLPVVLYFLQIPDKG